VLGKEVIFRALLSAGLASFLEKALHTVPTSGVGVIVAFDEHAGLAAASEVLLGVVTAVANVVEGGDVVVEALAALCRWLLWLLRLGWRCLRWLGRRGVLFVVQGLVGWCLALCAFTEGAFRERGDGHCSNVFVARERTEVEVDGLLKRSAR
jgi:hypothetical protein